MYPDFAHKYGGAGETALGVRFEGGLFSGAEFPARRQKGERLDLVAVDHHPGLFLIAHTSSASCVRSFRVARNNEFLTVSSVVPSASPMARSFKPW